MTFEEVEKLIRDSAPLSERLEESRRRIGCMCSERRPPRMRIPAQWDDDDLFIATTLKDAIAALTPNNNSTSD